MTAPIFSACREEGEGPWKAARLKTPQTAAAWGMRQPTVPENRNFIVEKLTSIVNPRFRQKHSLIFCLSVGNIK